MCESPMMMVRWVGQLLTATTSVEPSELMMMVTTTTAQPDAADCESPTMMTLSVSEVGIPVGKMTMFPTSPGGGWHRRKGLVVDHLADLHQQQQLGCACAVAKRPWWCVCGDLVALFTNRGCGSDWNELMMMVAGISSIFLLTAGAVATGTSWWWVSNNCCGCSSFQNDCALACKGP
jgi:hypothetical protein